MSHGGAFAGRSRTLQPYFFDSHVSGDGLNRPFNGPMPPTLPPVRTTLVPIEWRTSADPVDQRDHPGFSRILPPPASAFQQPLGMEIALLREAIMSRGLGAYASLVPPSSLSGIQTPSPNTILTEEEQNGALKKLRRGVHSPARPSLGSRLSLYYRDRYAEAVAARAEEEGKRCAVCLEDFEPKEEVMLTPCDHMFHDDCIVPWVKSNGNCPVCRFSLSDRRRSD